jgi:hypothetical protein
MVIIALALTGPSESDPLAMNVRAWAELAAKHKAAPAPAAKIEAFFIITITPQRPAQRLNSKAGPRQDQPPP